MIPVTEATPVQLDKQQLLVLAVDDYALVLMNVGLLPFA